MKELFMKYSLFIVLFVTQCSHCVIYKLNDSEYSKMPPLFHFDDYDSCVHQPNGIYCYVDTELVADAPSELLQMIHEYSEHTSTHFNHTQIHRGICLTKSCNKYDDGKKAVDPRLTLERCLNESLWREYKLKTRLLEMVSCKKINDPINITNGDIAAAVAFIFLMLLNIIGSIYDYYFVNGDIGNKFLLSFSLKRNLERLVSHVHTDPFQERLKGLNGLRVLSIILVILVHTPLPCTCSIGNPHDFEKTFYDIKYNIFYNGTLITQTFFILTGLLMSYNNRIYSEKNKLKWTLILKGIIRRWIRLTPAYAVVLIFAMTWLRFVIEQSGPMWEVNVGSEVKDCQKFAWSHLLYINNYVEVSHCMIHTWYSATHMQLYLLGLFVCTLANTPKRRNMALSALFIIGLLLPAIHTYVQDLDGVLVIAPETVRNLFTTNPTFKYSYARGHTNIPGIVIGLWLGNLLYEGLRDEKKIRKYKKLGILYYLTIPLEFALVLTGMVFYGDRPRHSIYVRIIAAALYRPLFGMLMSIFIIGMVFKFENLYRTMMEWHGYRTISRLSYSAYLIHVTIIRSFAGMNSTVSRFGLAQIIKEGSGNIFLTFLIAYPFWLFVEAPLNQAITVLLRLSTDGKKQNGELNMDGNVNSSERHINNLIKDKLKTT